MTPDRAATEDDLFALLRALDIETVTHRHEPLHTVDQSQAARDGLPDMPGGHCKNLFLKDKKAAFWLVVTLEDKKINMKALQKTLGSARLSFARSEYMLEKLGVEPGSVTPFAAINETSQGVQFVLDRDLLKYEILNYHPLHNAATTAINTKDLLIFLHHCGHQPLMVDMVD